MSPSRWTHFAGRAAEALREGGARGLAGRTARAALSGASAGLSAVSLRLERIALDWSLDGPSRLAVARTQALADRERGRAIYVLGPGAERETELLASLGDAPIVASWRAPALHDAPHATYLVGCDAAVDRRSFLASMDDAPTATFLLPLGAFPLDEAPSRLHFFAPTVHASRLHGVPLRARSFPSFADDLQIALAFALLLGGSPISLLGVDYDGLQTPEGGAFPATGPLPMGALSPWLAAPASTRYAEAARRCNRLFDGYRWLQVEAARRGQLVRTVGQSSFLDVFPRIPSSAAFP